MTLEYLTIDLSDVFECGMTYVAMSRGVTCDHMCVKGFKKEDVKTNPRVLAFDKTIRGEKSTSSCSISTSDSFISFLESKTSLEGLFESISIIIRNECYSLLTNSMIDVYQSH